MDVFGVGEVGEEGEDGGERSPIAEDAEGFGVGWSEEMRERGGEGLESVGAFGCEFRSGPDGSASYMEEDEGGDDKGVAGDLRLLDVLVEEGARVETEITAAGESEAADDECNDSEEDEEADLSGAVSATSPASETYLTVSLASPKIPINC